MSKAKSKYSHSGLTGLVDSDSEDTQFVEAMPTPDSAAENKGLDKKGRGRPKKASAKVTKVKAPARRTSGRLNSKTVLDDSAPVTNKRPALADKTNQQYASETEEVDEFADEDIVMEDAVSTKQTKTKTAKKTGPGGGKVVKGTSATNYNISDTAQATSKLASKTTKKKGQPRKEVLEELSPEKVVMETQIDMDAEEEIDEIVSKSARNVAQSRSHSRHRQPSIQRRRAGSASDTERSDPALRRKLGEVTKKYENLLLKYQDLREIGLKEGERNFERLRKQSEEKTKIANDLIAALKTDVAAQTTLVKESRGLKKKADSQASEIAALQTQLANLSTSLAEVRSENKTLSAKLAANRTAAASVESANTKTPGSAMKANGGIRIMGTAEAAQAAQAAQLKEDLYSDLTGLIIRNVKRESDEDIFDCIQTGRNGTLHFKLAAANDKSTDSYEDAQCSYVPQLDPSRDRPLMELLPDYLVDEITFPRPQAAKFYARVVKSLTEKST